MKKLNVIKYQTYSLIVISLFCFSGIQAQQTTLSSGGVATGNGGSMSFSVGQIVYTTYTGSTGNMAQGVQQPFEIMGVLGVDGLSEINLNLVAYPNPTSDFLKIDMNDSDFKDVTYQLYDINGRLLSNKKLSNSKTEINMKQLSSAIYYLKIMKNQKPVKILKIIKTN